MGKQGSTGSPVSKTWCTYWLCGKAGRNGYYIPVVVVAKKQTFSQLKLSLSQNKSQIIVKRDFFPHFCSVVSVRPMIILVYGKCNRAVWVRGQTASSGSAHVNPSGPLPVLYALSLIWLCTHSNITKQVIKIVTLAFQTLNWHKRWKW